MPHPSLHARLIGHFRPYGYFAVVTAIAIGLAALADVLLVNQLQTVLDAMQPAAKARSAAVGADVLAWLMQQFNSIFPSLGKQSRLEALWWIPLTILLLALMRLIGSFVGEYGSAWLASRVQHDMRAQMFARVLSLPTRYFDQHAGGLTLSRIAFDAQQVSLAGINVLTVLVRDSVMVVGYLVLMFSKDWQLTLLCLVLLPLVGGIVSVAGRRQRRLSRDNQDSMGELTRVLGESIGGQRVVKIFGGQAYEQQRFAAVAHRVRRLMVKQAATSALNSGLIVLLMALTMAAVIHFALLRAQADALSPGAFVAFFGALLAMQGPIKNLSKINEPLQRGLAAAESVFALIDQQPEVDHGQHQCQRARGEIEFRDIAFQYAVDDQDAKPALAGINLHIAAGESVALVGASGSGKSTLASLLPRFYDSSAGQILLDGVALADWRLTDLRQQIALVSQDVVLFNDSLAANIAYGDPAPDAARIEAAARAAYAHEFISKLPEGYATLVGENGTRLSGGQRQRLAIARALYKDAPVLILDEATSALDSESERQVQAALDVLMQGRTTLVIAHRLSTIVGVDRIVAMQDGRIVESGSHAELLAHNGLYARLHQQQQLSGGVA